MRNSIVLAVLLALGWPLWTAGLIGPTAAGDVTIRDPDGNVILKSTGDRDRPPANTGAKPKKTAPEGVLRYVPWPQVAAAETVVQFSGPEHFKKPARNSGTVNPRALVFRVKRGKRVFALALDSKDPKSQHFDLLRLDLTGKGDFRKAPVIRRSSAIFEPPTKEFIYHFDARPLGLELGDRKISVEFKCSYTEREGGKGQEPSRSIWFLMGTCAEGACRFGRNTYNVRFHDPNGDLCVNDSDTVKIVRPGLPGLYPPVRFKVDIGGGGFKQVATSYYGHPVFVDGRFWKVRVSDDGGKVTAKPWPLGRTGKVRIKHPSWSVELVGAKSVFSLRGGPEPVAIPPGRYRIRRYFEWTSADRKQRGAYLFLGEIREGVAQEPAVTVAAGRTVDISIGSPLIIALAATQQDGSVRFTLTYTGVAARRGLGFSGKWALPMRTVTIFNSSGKPVGKAEVDWFRGQLVANWKVPAHLKGTFFASAGGCPFPIRSEKVKFTITGRRKNR